MAKAVPVPAENYVQMRSQALGTSWRKLGFSSTKKNPNVWGILMEIGYPQAAVTLVCLIDGTVSLYFGNGGGVIGGGAHESVRMKAEEFINAAENFLKKMNPTKHHPLPDVDRVRFYALTFDGILTAQDNKNMADETHEFFPLLRCGHEVIAALRHADEAGTPSP